MYNKETGANRERRFPITVMEAVLGLPSYLQNQFSALADIYMPIEGISEAFTGQEFVYRKSPNTIKAKSLTLDRIKGKTIAWNQLVTGTYTGTPIVNGVERTRVDNHFHLEGTAGTTSYGPAFNWTELVAVIGHKYLYSLYAIGTGADSLKFADQYQETEPHSGSFIWTATGPTMIIQSYLTQGVAYDCDVYVGIIDLTLAGIADEISTAAEFDALYPGYYPYNPGTLISNDAEAVETTWVNQWDEEWEVGGIGSGEPFPDNSQMRSKNYTPVIAGASLYCKTPNALFIFWYDANKNYINEYAQVGNSSIVVVPNGARYLKLTDRTRATYDHDICINLSDPAINGQYFPYWKRTLQLGLNSFKVKDSQGNVITITGGLKSAGNVCDEIVGNKYIKRVGEVDLGSLEWTPTDWTAYQGSHGWQTYYEGYKHFGDNSSIANITSSKYVATAINLLIINASLSNNIAALLQPGQFGFYCCNGSLTEPPSGTLYYELANEEVYDLVEPLIYTTKAGTTEERISTNSDGLSAPFCCDMTYSANENNDAGNAQYAATAGRLLNTHKIWGQDFNGSEDVSGALTGVTTLDASGLATLRGGISVPAAADAKHGTLDFIDGDRIKHISVVTLEEYPASPDLNTLYIIYQD